MSIKKEVIKLLKDMSEIKDINEGAELKNDLFFDSMEMVMLMIELEDKFNIEIDEADMDPDSLKTVGDVVYLVERYEVNKNG